MKKNIFYALLFLLFVVFQAPSVNASVSVNAFVIDHNCTDLNEIPDEWLTKAKNDLHVVYQHTSHGSQLITGMNALRNYPAFGSKYDWDDAGARAGALDLDDYGIPGCADLSQGDQIDGNGVTPWVTATRNLLNNPANNHVNVVMWSWCSINNHNIDRYIENMEILISEYSVEGTSPRAADHPVQFVFMTGHAQGQGEGGFIHTANQQIRQHCIDNDRILFDFADIENYNPDGDYFYDRPMWDDLDYTNASYRDSNWGAEWIAANPGSELEQLTTGNGVAGYSGCGSCAHSGSAATPPTLNCVLKGRAAWWMMAKLAGWNESSAESEISAPVPGTTLSSTSVTFEWNNSGAEKYWLDIGTNGPGSNNFYHGSQGINTSRSVDNLPNNGETLYVRLWSSISGDWFYNDYTYTACVCDISVPEIQSPAPGSTLGSTSVTFTWDSGGDKYWLSIGVTDTGSSDVYNTDQGTNTSVTIDNLPCNGETLYVRLWTRINNWWFHKDYTYTASISTPSTPGIQNPTPESSLDSTSVTFNWDSGGDKYWLDIGTTGAGSNTIYCAGQGTNTSVTIDNLPNSGETLYVRLWTRINSLWLYNDYTYTACVCDSSAPEIQSPVPGSTLGSTSVTFTWESGGDKYWLYIGTTGTGSYDVYNVDQGTNTWATIDNLPGNGETLYLRLWTRINHYWLYHDYTYTSYQE